MKNKIAFSRGVVAALAVVLSLQAPFAQAAIVDTDAMTPQSQLEQDRAKVQSFVERANVKERLQAMGVEGVIARDRVAALSEQEVHALAQRIDSMPAGAAISTYEWILIALVALLIVVLV
ncbi:MAG TPA: PA2779 family protein [Ramlibacter sp.]|nr:PA2779 family protein [Ramlibacter sp.]